MPFGKQPLQVLQDRRAGFGVGALVGPSSRQSEAHAQLVCRFQHHIGMLLREGHFMMIDNMSGPAAHRFDHAQCRSQPHIVRIHGRLQLPNHVFQPVQQ